MVGCVPQAISEELKQIEQVAQAAIGVDSQRGDIVTVQEMAFDRSDAIEVAAPTVMDRARKGLSDFSSEIRYAMLLVLFAMAYFLMIRPDAEADPGCWWTRRTGWGYSDRRASTVSSRIFAETARGDTQRGNTERPVAQEGKGRTTSSARAVQTWLREEAE